MAAKQLPIDLKVLRVIAYRYKWLLVILTFVSFTFSTFITKSLISLYTASITIFVDPENVLGDIAKGVAVSSNLKDQLTTIRHQILNDKFIEDHVIQELNLRFSDVYVPPWRLTFMPRVMEGLEQLKNMIKTLFRLEVYYLSDAQKQALQMKELVRIIKVGTVLRQSRGMLLTISYKSPASRASQEIVEVFANQCKELLLRSKNQETREAVRYIERQYNDATLRLEDLEKELTDMRVKYFASTPEAKIALLQQHQQTLDILRLIQQQLEDIRVSEKELMTKQTNRRQDLLQDPEMLKKLNEWAQTREARILETKKVRLEELLTVYTDEWPEVIKLKQEIAALEKTIETNIEEASEKARETILLADPEYYKYFSQLQDIEREKSALTTREKDLQDNMNVYEEKLKSMPEIEENFGAIQRRISLYAKLQVDLATKRETARATMQLEKYRGDNRIRLIGRNFPNKPSGMPPIVIMGALCLVGPSVGSGLIFLLYYFNTSVKSPDDVQVEYNVPVIAIIPNTNFKRELKRHEKLLKRINKLRKGKKASKTLPLSDQRVQVIPPSVDIRLKEEVALQHIEPSELELWGKIVKHVPIPNWSGARNLSMVTMLSNPESQAAEEYRRLCFNVEWGVKDALAGSCSTIMVTSALPNEGKTITALNLASTLARNHKVLLIDSNFRKPRINSAFGIPQGIGLSDMIENNDIPQLFVPPSSPNLSILPAGMALGHPADLLSSKQMQSFIGSVKDSPYFEYAIFDVPPISFIPDSSIIASKLDGIVWVIWELNTSKEIVRLALTRVTNPAILGVVLNRSEQRILPKKYDKVWRDYQWGPTGKKKGRA